MNWPAVRRSELANIHVERARLAMHEAQRQRDAKEKSKLMDEARGHYEQAGKAFAELTEDIARQLSNLPAGPANPAKRDRLRADYVKTQLISAVVLRERVDTIADKEARNAALKEAADAYGTVYEKYRRRLAGLYARLMQAECYQELGDSAEAVKLYGELVEQPTDPEPLRVLHTKTMVGLVNALIHPASGKVKEAIIVGKPWLDEQRPDEAKDPDWLALRMAMAKAYQLWAATADTDKQRNEWLGAALEYAKVAAAVAGDHRVEAQKLVIELSKDTPSPMAKDAATFEEALELGKELMEHIKVREAVMRTLQQRLNENLPENEADSLQNEFDRERADWKTQQAIARHRLEQCLELAGPETPPDDLATARYYLCHVCYQQRRYEQAIDAAMPIVADAPGHAAAQYVAWIACVSHMQLFNAAEDEPLRRVHVERLLALNDQIYHHWPESDVAKRSAEAAERLKRALEENGAVTTP